MLPLNVKLVAAKSTRSLSQPLSFENLFGTSIPFRILSLASEIPLGITDYSMN